MVSHKHVSIHDSIDMQNSPFTELGAVEVGASVSGPLAGTISFNAVRLTGAGAFAVVKLVLRPGAIKTGPPPAPTADKLGAKKGTNKFWLSGPGIVPLILVRGISDPLMLLFTKPVTSATKEYTLFMTLGRLH